MKKIIRTLSISGMALFGLAACGDDNASSAAPGKSNTVSGRYVGEVAEPGINMELDFGSAGKVRMTWYENGTAVLDDPDCTYQAGEARIAVSCFASSGISMTRLDGGDLEGDLDGTIVRFVKK